MNPRTLLVNLALFLLPFLVYVVYAWVAQRAFPKLDRAPLAWLAGAGLACVAAGLGVLGLQYRGSTGGVYAPPRYEDGRVVPGRIIAPDPQSGAADTGAGEMPEEHP